MSAVKEKQVVKDITNAVAKALNAGIDAAAQAAVDPHKGRLDKLNTDGEMLMCTLTVNKREGASPTFLQTVNDTPYWIPRGREVRVPWFVVQAMLDNVETKYVLDKDEGGKTVRVPSDMQTESFNFQAINPAEGVVFPHPK